jgi:hypothetical protein
VCRQIVQFDTFWRVFLPDVFAPLSITLCSLLTLPLCAPATTVSFCPRIHQLFLSPHPPTLSVPAIAVSVCPRITVSLCPRTTVSLFPRNHQLSDCPRNRPPALSPHPPTLSVPAPTNSRTVPAPTNSRCPRTHELSDCPRNHCLSLSPQSPYHRRYDTFALTIIADHTTYDT